MNIIINNGHQRPEDGRLFFGDEEVTLLKKNTDMFDVLVLGGFFKSKGEARRNWRRSTAKIPDGFSHFTGIGKLRRELAILNPIPDF